MVDEYCCCLFPGCGFFAGSLPLQAWGLPWVGLASPPPGCSRSSSPLQAAIWKRHGCGRCCIDHQMHLMMGREGCTVAKCFSKCFLWCFSKCVSQNASHDGAGCTAAKCFSKCFSQSSVFVANVFVAKDGNQISRIEMYPQLLQKMSSLFKADYLTTEQRSHSNLLFCSHNITPNDATY